MNPQNAEDIQDVRRAVEFSRQKLQVFRSKRLDAIRQYVGANYSSNGAEKSVPFPLLSVSVEVYQQNLVPAAPRFCVSTNKQGVKPKADKLEMGLNHLVDREIKLEQTLGRAVMNGMFLTGTMKVGMESRGKMEIDGFRHDIGQPFADVVDDDDWVHDVNATVYEKVSFSGNRYRLPYWYVMESDWFENKENLKPTRITGTNEGGDVRAETISRGTSLDQGDYQSYVELWDLWYPLENMLVTLPAENGMPLHVNEWEGPEGGPFHRLCFSDVPGQIMPLPPVALWMDMHMLANSIFRKLEDQIRRQKTFTGYASHAEQDAKNILTHNDGDMILMDNPDGVREFSTGGADPRSLAFLIQLRDFYSWLAGNLDSLGGLGVEAQTLGQEELLAGNNSKRLEKMQNATRSFVRDIGYDLGWYLWYDPLIELPLSKRIAGTNITIPVTFSPADREGDYLEFNMDIDPYSMQYLSPAKKLALLDRVMANYVLPLMPVLQQQGIGINIEGLLRTIARYSNMSDLDQILTFANGMMNQPQAIQPDALIRQGMTQRHTIRTNRSGGTRTGRDNAMMQTLMGAGVQNAQADATMTGNNR